jgi:hypothetical protein
MPPGSAPARLARGWRARPQVLETIRGPSCSLSPHRVAWHAWQGHPCRNAIAPACNALQGNARQCKAMQGNARKPPPSHVATSRPPWPRDSRSLVILGMILPIPHRSRGQVAGACQTAATRSPRQRRAHRRRGRPPDIALHDLFGVRRSTSNAEVPFRQALEQYPHND